MRDPAAWPRPERCYRCGETVDLGTGTTSRRRPGGWVTQHMTCATAYHGTDAEGVARPVDMADAIRIRDARAGGA
jgi:hypothetical protein